MQSVDYEANETLIEINDRFKNFRVHIVNWPDELQNNLGKLKEYAYMGFPKNKPSGKLPLLVALHGAGGKAKTLEEQLFRSSKVKGLALAEISGRDLILLEPNSYDSWEPDKLDVMLDYVLSTYKDIDEKQIYVVGHSMGGSGTWRWALRSADRFAAVSPCGFGSGGNMDGMENVLNLPIWAMVGGADKEPYVNGIQTMVDNLRAQGAIEVKHTVFPGLNHPQGNAAVFSSVELVEWMLSLSKERR